MKSVKEGTMRMLNAWKSLAPAGKKKKSNQKKQVSSNTSF